MASIVQYSSELEAQAKSVPPSNFDWNQGLVTREVNWAEQLKDKHNIFIIGGGSDVIGAYALAEHIQKVAGKTKDDICLGIGKDPKRPERIAGLTSLTKHIFRTPQEVIDPYPGMPTWGTWTMEQTIPRYKDGSPYIVVLPTTKDIDVNKILVEEMKSLNFDAIVGVDLGGDSVTGGIDFPDGKPQLGRDVQMKDFCAAVGVPYYHVVLAPCVDGETHFDKMYTTLQNAYENNTLLGCFKFEEHMLPIFYHYSPNIEEGRTVNLILKANEYKLTAPFSEHPSFFEVPRNLSPIVPPNDRGGFTKLKDLKQPKQEVSY